MLTGHELVEALERAIALKGVKTADVARHFGIKGPSLYDWLKHGRIGKQHLSALISYFSDVVPPSHWGLDPSAEAAFTPPTLPVSAGEADTPLSHLAKLLAQTPDELRPAVGKLLESLALTPESPKVLDSLSALLKSEGDK
jgi:hypothetical protein